MATKMYDVIVIGGGPGGAVCARELAGLGHSVVLLEKGAKGRNRPSAGGIAPRNYTVTPMKQDIVQRAVDSGFFCTAQGSTFRIDAGDDLGYIVYRADFDRYLHELAEKAGAELVFNAPAQEVVFEDGGVTVNARRTSGRRKFRARAVVAAFGSGGGKLPQVFGIKHESVFQAVMLEVKLPKKQVDEQFGSSVETYMDSSITSQGRIWIYPKRDGVAVGITAIPDDKKETMLDRLLGFMNNHPVASEKLKGWKPYYGALEESTFARTIPRVPLKKSYGDRYVVVGDAAGAADPLTGEGIYHAQRTGLLASRVLHKCLRDDDLSADALAEYQRRWYKAVVKYDTCYNMKSADVLFDCPHQDDVMEALLNVAQNNERVKEAVLWVFAGLRSQREAMVYAASPRLIFQIFTKLTLKKAAPLIPRILRTYSLRDLL